MSNLQQRIEKVEVDIQDVCNRTGRQRSDITVVAVTKEVSAARATEMISAGFANLGENRPDVLIEKQEVIQSGAIWHFIGNIQSRRVKDIINQVDFLHSIDRMSIVKEIQKRADHIVDCFVQVNVSGEESKSGFTTAELTDFIEKMEEYDKVRVIGLMTKAPFTEDEAMIRSVFKSLRELRDEIAAKKLPYAPCTKLSMGMSNDFIIAIEEGATHIRIGTALVGSESEENL